MDAGTATAGVTLEELKLWVPTIVSIITLLINMGFYVFGQSRLGYKYKRKEELAKISEEMCAYLSEIVSLESFTGVPTKIRNYSLRIHLCFKDGTAKKKLADKLEEIFQAVKQRKTLNDAQDIEAWNERFRNQSRELRKQLGKYCGGL